MNEENKKKILDAVDKIRIIQTELLTLSEQLEDEELNKKSIEIDASQTIEGKNKEEREQKLFLKLKDNEEYTNYLNNIKLNNRSIEERKIELEYHKNLFKAYRIIFQDSSE